jgi:LPXTG-motif cell wall-anchored protein
VNGMRYEFAVAAANVLGTGGLSEPATATPEAAAIALSTSDVADGGRVTVRVTGLVPGQEYVFVMHSTPVVLGAATADGDGVVVFAFTVPASVAPGPHTITVHPGDASAPEVARAAITVTAASVLPATGMPASAVAVPVAFAVLTLAAGGVLALRRRTTA